MDINVDPKQARKVIDDVKPIIGSLIAQGCLNHPMAASVLEWAAKEIEDKLEEYAIKSLEQHNAPPAAGS